MKRLCIAACVWLALCLWLGLLLGSAFADDLPYYCKAITKFDRSCFGVKAAVAALGRNRALSLAKRCGASDVELNEAAACLAPKPQTCPPEWKCNGSRETNDPACYHSTCQR